MSSPPRRQIFPELPLLPDSPAVGQETVMPVSFDGPSSRSSSPAKVVSSPGGNLVLMSPEAPAVAEERVGGEGDDGRGAYRRALPADLDDHSESTDRASNYSKQLSSNSKTTGGTNPNQGAPHQSNNGTGAAGAGPPVPTTVVAAIPDVPGVGVAPGEGGGGSPGGKVKLTAEALALNTSMESVRGGVSGYLGGIQRIQPAVLPSAPAALATVASASHFAPFEDVSSLGSVHEDELIDANVRSKQAARDDALMARENGHSSATLKVLNTTHGGAGGGGGGGSGSWEAGGRSRSSSGLSDLFHPAFHEALPVRPSSAVSPARAASDSKGGQQSRGTLLPMGVATKIDSTLAHVRPPSAPSGGVSPYAAQLSPTKFVRNKSGSNGNGKGGHHGGVEFSPIPKTKDRPALTRTSSSSNASSSSNRIRLGICAMDKKARSKPMAAILQRLDAETFEPVFFGDGVILNEPVEAWPVCDVLIAFYSNGYPLEKAEEYVSLRQPYLLNDLKMQRTLMDRRRVYDLLEECGIDVPKHVFMSRDGYVSSGTGDGNAIDDSDVCCAETNECDDDKKSKKNKKGKKAGKKHKREPTRTDVEIDEHDDHIEVNGVIIQKPFVEKPVDADDHNIAIYYPSSAGGGCKKLFRKVGDRSSEFYPDINEIRRDGSYIYEEFIETQGTDVKMYTVGPDYGHAEARKSPTVDGKVERNAEGKEVRFPVILTLREKEIARR